VPLEIVVLAAVRLIRTHGLLVEAFDVRRQEAVQSEFAPLFLREPGPLVQSLAVEKLHPPSLGLRSRKVGGLLGGHAEFSCSAGAGHLMHFAER
jgi:hypothetical protein